jgi:hypothetical protein
LHNAPHILVYPQPGFSSAILTTRHRRSSTVAGRPTLRRLPLESYFFAMSLRCHASKVCGVTRLATSLQAPVADRFGLARQAASLDIRGFQPFITVRLQLLFPCSDLLLQVVDHMLLLPVHPARRDHQNHFHRVHRGILRTSHPDKQQEIRPAQISQQTEN